MKRAGSAKRNEGEREQSEEADLASMLRMIARERSRAGLTARGRSVGDSMGAAGEDRSGVGAAGEEHGDGAGTGERKRKTRRVEVSDSFRFASYSHVERRV